MPLSSYDLIIGYPTIDKYNLLSKLQALILTARVEQVAESSGKQSNALEYTLMGALLNENLGSQFPHISNLLEGTGDDGDDITELFTSESPWNQPNNKADPSPDDLINLIEMNGSPAFQKKNADNMLKL